MNPTTLDVDAWEWVCVSTMALIAFLAAVCYLFYWLWDQIEGEIRGKRK